MPNAPIRMNTTVRLFFWAAADIAHQNICYYASEALRDEAFDALPKTTGDKTEGFVFVSENKVRIPYCLTQVQGYNYMFYRNPGIDGDQGTGTHRIYAFITDMKYINISTTELTFEVDYWTTYYPFVSFSRLTYIERCHPASDTYGANVEGEPIEVGLTTMVEPVGDIVHDPLSGSAMTNLVVLQEFEDFVLTTQRLMNHATPRFYAGGRGCSAIRPKRFLISTANGQQEARNYFARFDESDYANFANGVAACYIAPAGVEDVVMLGTGHNVTVPRPTAINTSIGDYTPTWQKTLQYPFVFCEASVGTNVQQYQFENSANENKNMVFDHTGTDIGTVTITGVPKYYKGQQYNIEESITLTGFPQVSWNSSAFAQWLNENGNKMAMSGIMSGIAALGGVGAIAGGIMTANPMMALGGAAATAGAVTSIAGQADNYRIAASKAPISHGTPDPNSMYLNDKFHIYYSAVSILPKHAERIDNFFDHFGYAQNATMNLRNQFFNNHNNPGFKGSYIKTKNYSAKGNSVFVPAKALRYISAIFDRGVTMWPSVAMN